MIPNSLRKTASFSIVAICIVIILGGCVSGSNTPTLPHYGMFLMEQGKLLELVEGHGATLPQVIPSTGNAQPTIYAWIADLNISLVVLTSQSDTSAMQYTTQPVGNDILALQPRTPLASDRYCFREGDPSLPFSLLRNWCFVVGTNQENVQQPNQVQNNLQNEIVGTWDLIQQGHGGWGRIIFFSDGVMESHDASGVSIEQYSVKDNSILVVDHSDANLPSDEVSINISDDILTANDSPTDRYMRFSHTTDTSSIGLQGVVEQINVSDGLFLYSAPDVDSGQLVGILPGSSFTLVGFNTPNDKGEVTWHQIQYEGQTGWICREGTLVIAGLQMGDDASSIPVTDSTSNPCNETPGKLAAVVDRTLDGTLTGAVPQVATAIYVNGITTTYQDHLDQRKSVVEAFNEPVMGVYNASFSRKEDILQALADIQQGLSGSRSLLISSNPDNVAARSLARQIRNYFERGGDHLDIIAHSQGTAITSAAFNLLMQDGNFNQWEKITVYTFGNVAISWPFGPIYEHCIHEGDFVTLLPSYPQFVSASNNDPNSRLTTIPGVRSKPDVFTVANNDAPNHALSGYLDDFKRGSCPRTT